MGSSTVAINIVGDARKFKGATEEAEGALSRLGGKVASFGAGLVAGFGLDKVTGLVGDAVGLASDLQEATSKNTVVFGAGAKAIEDASKGAATAMGLSRTKYMELSGTLGVLGKSAGLTGDDLAAFSKDAAARAADIGSFNNAATPEVIEAWGAAMRGEMEPMRRFGVLIDDNALRNKALAMGLITSTKDALTPQTKALAANALIMEQTKDAAGDFARTSDGLANKQRILGAQFDNLKTKAGEKLIPAFSAVVGFITDKMLPAIERFAPKVQAAFESVAAFTRETWPKVQAAIGTVVDWLTTYVVPVVQAVVDFVTEKFGELVAWVEENWPAISEAIGHVMVAIQTVIEAVIAVVKKAWETWGEDILAYASNIFETIKRVIEAAMGVIRGIIMTVVSLINGDWGKAWDNIKATLGAAWDGIYALLRGAVTAVGVILSALWKPIEWGLDAAWGMVRNMWDTIVGFVTGLPARIAGAASGMWDGFKDAFRSAINWIIGKWNGLQFTIPGFDIPGLGSVGGATVGVPDIPFLAKGGIVTRPTLAMIGEKGPEAVVPLGAGGGSGFGGPLIGTMNVYAGMGANGQQIGQQILDEVAKVARVNGNPTLLAAVGLR